MRRVVCDVCGDDAAHEGVDLMTEDADPEWTMDLCDVCYQSVQDAIGRAITRFSDRPA